MPGSIRAIWVTRWDYKSANDIAVVMNNCRQAGFNTVLFQVRGNGTAFYRSKIEPWADELGGRDPGFDPLAVACREGHRRGLSVHAWVNVMPGWRGDHPPANRRQLYHRHPGWFLHDSTGRRQPLGWYVSLNPCLPEVRAYLVGVMKEIVANYPVDGLHMDYIRFPNERSKAYEGWPAVPDYPRDARTLALFRRASGGSPERNPQEWTRWRNNQVTQLVYEIRSMMRVVRPQALLSAAVGADPDSHKQRHFQDVRTWIEHDLIQVAYPMNYAADAPRFQRRLNVWKEIGTHVPVVTGIMIDQRDPVTASQQLRQASASSGHLALFAYNSLFPRLEADGRPVHDDHGASRNALRAKVIPLIRELGSRRPSHFQLATGR